METTYYFSDRESKQGRQPQWRHNPPECQHSVGTELQSSTFCYHSELQEAINLMHGHTLSQLSIRDGQFNEKTTFSFSSSHHETGLKFFKKLNFFSLWLSLLSDHIQGNCRKRLSDFDKIKFYQHLYHFKRKRLNKNMIKTFNWLVLGNKWEIYLFTKEMKKKKKVNMTLENLLYHTMFSNRKKGKQKISE